MKGVTTRTGKAQQKNAEETVNVDNEVEFNRKRSRSRSVSKGKAASATETTETERVSPPHSKAAKVVKTKKATTRVARKINFGNEAKDGRKAKGKNNNASPLPSAGECSQTTDDSMELSDGVILNADTREFGESDECDSADSDEELSDDGTTEADSVTIRRPDPSEEREERKKEYAKLLQDEDFRSMFGELFKENMKEAHDAGLSQRGNDSTHESNNAGVN